jgi:RNA polymerase-interacting CarD/CdnL/TRCF family regulator
VAGIEKREFGQTRQEFYVLELARSGKLLLPTANVEQAGLVSASEARALMKRVTTAPKLDRTPLKQRAALYAEGLRGGAADRYTEILRQLLFRARTDKLSSTERHLLETARAYFVGEIGAALKRSPERIAEQLPSMADGSPHSGESTS